MQAAKSAARADNATIATNLAIDVAAKPQISHAGTAASPSSSRKSTTSPKHSRQQTRSRPSSSSKLSYHHHPTTGSLNSHVHYRVRGSSPSPSTSGRKIAGLGNISTLNNSTTEQRQGDLLALHFQSCQLFQDAGDPPAAGLDATEPTDPQTGSSKQKQPPPSLPFMVPTTEEKQPYVSERTDPSGPATSSSVRISDEMAIDWMTPSTRRREYEQIDRANRGFRRWRPRCCRGRDTRTPFFEEKGGRGNYEGSVRRFRMDLPDDDGPPPRPSERFVRSSSSVKGQLLPKISGSKKGGSWLCCFG